MKILVLSFYYPPDLCAGSFRAFATVESLIDKLPENSIIDVVTTTPNRYKSFSSDLKNLELSNRVNVHRIDLPDHQSGMLDQSQAFACFFYQALKYTYNKEYSLVYSTSSRLMTAVLGSYIARSKKAPLYLDIRDIFTDTMNNILSKKSKWLIMPFLNLLEKYAINSASHVNLVSEGFKGYFFKNYPSKNYTFFTNGVDEDFLDLSCKGGKKGTAGELKKIIYAGNIGEGQGLHKILPQLAASLQGEAEFLVIGDGGIKSELISAVEKKKLKNLRIIDPVDRGELINYYLGADVLFLHLNDYPAFEKVLPSKIFEYAALGKPIWAGVPGYAADFLNSEVCNSAVFPPCDHEKALSEFSNLKLIDEPRNAFIDKFSRKKIMNEMAESIIFYEKTRAS